MNSNLVKVMDNPELFEQLSRKAARQLETDSHIAISFPLAIPTMVVSFLEQLLDEANGYNIIVRRNEDGNMVFAKGAPQDYGYDNLLEIQPVGGLSE